MYQITLFGTLTIARERDPLPLKLLPGAREILAYLLLNRSQPVARDRLAAILWPDMPEDKGKAKLRRNLYDLRNGLAAIDAAETWLLLDHSTLQWAPTAACAIDVEEFQRLSDVAASYAEAEALYQGDLLQDFYVDWVAAHREHLRLNYLTLLENLVQQLSANRQHDRALEVANKLQNCDPLSESTVQHIMRLRHVTGDRVGAMRAYSEFESLLADELGVEPLAETQTLNEKIRDDVDHVLFKSDGRAELPNNLRALPNRFFGRTQELALLHRQLTNVNGPRLITVTGTGGCGKTRLVRQLGQRLLENEVESYLDAIFFVDLATITEPSLVMTQIAQTIGLANKIQSVTPKAIAEALEQQRMLLLLDNFEQVLSAASLVSDLLAYAPALHIVATSRAPLRCYGEYEVRLQPLDLPQDDALSLEALLENQAIALFLDRATAANPAFALSAENSGDIIDVCRRLDGLPLAFEIASATLKFRSIASLRSQLETHATKIRNRTADLPDRHVSLYAVIDWGYQLLSAEAQHLFKALSVFPADFDSQAVQAILLPDDDVFDVEETLLSLVEHSLLQVESTQDKLRFRTLVTIRDFAQTFVTDQSIRVSWQQAHLTYFATFSKTAYSHLYKDNQKVWLATLRCELENVRAAMAFALQQSEPQSKALFVRFLVWLDGFWKAENEIAEQYYWYLQIRPHLDALEKGDRVRVLTGLSIANRTLGGEKKALHATLEEALKIAREPGVDRELLVKTLNTYAVIARETSNFGKAAQLLNEGIAHARLLYKQKSNDYYIRFLLNILNTQGTLYNRMERFEDAVSCFQEALVLANNRNFRSAEASCSVNLSNAYRGLGALSESAEHLHNAFTIALDISDQSCLLVCLSNAAEWYAERDSHETATVFHSALKAASDRANRVWPSTYLAEFNGYVASAKASLTTAQFDDAWQTGHAMSLDDATQFAFDTLNRDIAR